VLETLMYAALLENAPFDKADIAYTVLGNYYIDWNEIRVCSLRELADTLMDLPNPEAAADRVRRALQGIFEKTYMFDLEEMRKKGKALAEHIKTLESMSAGTPYMIQYTAQVALDGHLIPLDEASLRIMRRLGLSQVSNDGTQEICIGIDRVILKKSGLTFAAQLHHFAAGYYDVPDSPELLSRLSAIDPEAVNRNWTSPILPSSSASKTAATSAPVLSAVSTPRSESSPEPPKPETPAKQLAKPVSKPQPKPVPKKILVKPPKKAAKKPVPAQSAAKSLKTPVQTKTSFKSVKVPKTPPKKLKVPSDKKVPGKKAVPSGKSAKPLPPKKKAIPKRAPSKPIKKPMVKMRKGGSPSNSLRKKKPK